jgi:hypothetical protein
MVTPAGAIGALAMLRDQALQPHPTGRLEQIGADLALLEGRDEDRLCPPRLTANPERCAHRGNEPDAPDAGNDPRLPFC